MTTPTTMTTSMITTATTMMTDVVVVPSLERLLVGGVLLTGTVPVVVNVPKNWGGEVVPTVWEEDVVSTVRRGVVVGGGVVSSGVDAVERKYITWYSSTIYRYLHSSIGKWVSLIAGLEYGMKLKN